MTTAMDDRSVAQRVLDHIANGTTDLGQQIWREPVANYRSPERLKAEIESVLRCTPTPFCPSAALPEVGSYVAREAAGIPIVVVRGSDGKVQAFRNACRHRGMQVADGSGCTRASSAVITVGPTISTASCATFPTRTAFRASTRRRIRWCR